MLTIMSGSAPHVRARPRPHPLAQEVGATPSSAPRQPGPICPFRYEIQVRERFLTSKTDMGLAWPLVGVLAAPFQLSRQRPRQVRPHTPNPGKAATLILHARHVFHNIRRTLHGAYYCGCIDSCLRRRSGIGEGAKGLSEQPTSGQPHWRVQQRHYRKSGSRIQLNGTFLPQQLPQK